MTHDAPSSDMPEARCAAAVLDARVYLVAGTSWGKEISLRLGSEERWYLVFFDPFISIQCSIFLGISRRLMDPNGAFFNDS